VKLDAVLVLAAAAAVVAYAFSLWRWPTRPCRACGGTGRVAGSTGRRAGRCPRCKDKPPKRRLGAAAVAALIGERYGKRYW
jgi:hypothetical protein